MDKVRLYKFSIELKKLLSDGSVQETERKLKEAGLNNNEINFVFQCLRSNGYDPITDQFILFESDNSAFLNLVSIVQSKLSSKK